MIYYYQKATFRPFRLQSYEFYFIPQCIFPLFNVCNSRTDPSNLIINTFYDKQNNIKTIPAI